MRGPLFVANTVAAIERALARARSGGAIAVLGPTRVGRALADAGQRVVLMSDRLRSLRRLSGPRTYARGEALPVADAALAGLVGFGVGEREDWEPVVREWSRAVIGGGVVVLVDRGAPAELSRRALCGGLTDIAQELAGRTAVTSGRVRKL